MALGVLYNSGFWIRSSKAVSLGNMIFRFLSLYAKCAEITLHQKKKRFGITPKLHMMAHCAHDLVSQGENPNCDWAMSPLSSTNQIQEDFIGRPARISRRVNIRSIHSSLMMRSQIMYQESLKLSDQDKRGMDGYKDL